jgi:hypothetical protein
MKTTIAITGQINGNFALKNAIETYNSETKKGMFNSFNITFPSKKEAKKALWEAFKYLRSDKQDAEASMLSYSKYGSLSYDASKAVILD